MCRQTRASSPRPAHDTRCDTAAAAGRADDPVPMRSSSLPVSRVSIPNAVFRIIQFGISTFFGFRSAIHINQQHYAKDDNDYIDDRSPAGL